MIGSTPPGARAPRIALMGEFSAGKSTLCNMLMHSETLPEKVTATRLAPVWMTKGPGQHMRVCIDGTEEPIKLEWLDKIPVKDTAYIRLCLEEEMLEHCDFIDCPGISDPNMDPDTWGRVLQEADAVIWLTHATQAWRQSEAAVWDDVSDDIKAKSILLLTRWDKLITEQDRKRVYTRIAKETDGLFRTILPVSLTQALDAGDDYEAWQASGAADLMEQLSSLIADLNNPEQAVAKRPAAPVAVKKPAPVAEQPKPVAKPAPSNEPIAMVRRPAEPQPAQEDTNVVRIVPRRVRPEGSPRRARPSRSMQL